MRQGNQCGNHVGLIDNPEGFCDNQDSKGVDQDIYYLVGQSGLFM